MAKRRMFSSEIVESDAFLSMPLTAQALYFHLGIVADDDGFVGSLQRTMRMLGNMPDDLNILIAKRFLIDFPSEGVAAIKHWRMNNLLKTDRHHQTPYSELAKKLVIKENGSYSEDTSQGRPLIEENPKTTVGIPVVANLEPKWNPNGTQLEPEVSVVKVSEGKKDKDVSVNLLSVLSEESTKGERILTDEQLELERQVENMKRKNKYLPPLSLEEYKKYTASKGRKGE